MKALLALALASVAGASVGAPAFAQPMDHSQHGMDHGEHTGHQMPGEQSEAQPEEQGGPTGTDQPPGSAPPPPVAHDRPADHHYGATAMAEAEAAMMGAHSPHVYGQVIFDIAEYRVLDGRDGYRWEAEAWVGDLNRFVVRTEGEGTFREKLESAELQALYSRALDPWWNLQAGVRQDIRPKPARTHATLAIEGRAPYQLHLLAAAFLSGKGQLTGRFEGSYDQWITQRLVLQPRLELNLSAQDMPARRLGAGLNDAELGLRLRYEVKREFAPYIGVSWTWKAGRTADYARLDGEDPTERSLVLGIRGWF